MWCLLKGECKGSGMGVGGRSKYKIIFGSYIYIYIYIFRWIMFWHIYFHKKKKT